MGLNEPLWQQFFTFVEGHAHARLRHLDDVEQVGRLAHRLQPALHDRADAGRDGHGHRRRPAARRLARRRIATSARRTRPRSARWSATPSPTSTSARCCSSPSRSTSAGSRSTAAARASSTGSTTCSCRRSRSAFVKSAFVGRLTRTALLEVLGKDYVRTARAKGARETRVIYRHGLRNALLPLTTGLGLSHPLDAVGLGRDRAGLQPAGHRQAADQRHRRARLSGDPGRRRGLRLVRRGRSTS